MHELLLELPKQAADSRSIVARIRPELVDRLDESGVRLTEYSPPSADDGADPPANVIRFKRELKAEYDERTREFTAIPARIHPESTAVVLLSADGAARHVRARTWLSLPGRVRRCAGLNPKGQVVMLIHGLAKLYKQEKSAADKAYDARVRALSGAPAPAPARRAGARDEQAFVSKDDMERAIVQLQVIDRSFITRGALPSFTVNWLHASLSWCFPSTDANACAFPLRSRDGQGARRLPHVVRRRRRAPAVQVRRPLYLLRLRPRLTTS